MSIQDFWSGTTLSTSPNEPVKIEVEPTGEQEFLLSYEDLFSPSLFEAWLNPDIIITNNNNKKMNIINNVFKTKENKALELFDMGSVKQLNNRGQSEFVDFLFETLKEDRKAFLDVIVKEYDKSIKNK